MRGPSIAFVAAVGGALLVPAAPLAEDPPKPPTAAVQAASHEVQAGDSIELDSSTSQPGDAPISGHVWDLDGNGTFETDTGADPKATAKPDTVGPLTVHARVVDSAGLQSDATFDLTVTAPPMKPAETVAADAAAAPPAKAAPRTSLSTKPPALVSKPSKRATAPPAARMTKAPSLKPRDALTGATAQKPKPHARPALQIRSAAASGVTIKDFKFAPASITVHVGDTITWTNQDIAPHTASASDGSFDTGTIDKGKSGSATFSKAGTIPYICSIHPNMKGTVVVAAASGSSGGGGSDSGSAGGTDTGGSDPGATSGGTDSGGLPHTGLNLLAVVLLASLMTGSGTVLRRRVG
jgi:plastocyanin